MALVNGQSVTKTSLKKMKKNELIDFAKKNSISVSAKLKKDEIIDLILKKDKAPEKTIKKMANLKKSAPSSEVIVEKSKYEMISKEADQVSGQLNNDYFIQDDKNYFVLMVQNPYWCFSYWNISHNTIKEAKKFFNQQFSKAKLTIRVYNISRSKQEERAIYFDIPVNDHSTSWYINIPRTDQTYKADIGFKLGHRFFIATASNEIYVPGTDMKETLADQKDMGIRTIPENADYYPQTPQELSREDITKILSISGGLSIEDNLSSASLMKQVLESVSSQISSQISSRPQGEQPPVQEHADFWYKLECELIVRGQTLPDAKVYLNDKQELILDAEGKFEIRMPLPDGLLELKTVAVSKDQKFSKTITPVVSKKTDYA